MPELPEVNTFKKYFDGTSLQQRILHTTVQDDKIIRNCSGDEFADRLMGRLFTGSTRRGKYLFGHLDNGHHVLFHFGMTGDLKYYRDTDQRPKHERFHFLFDSDFYLGFDCPRKFARIVYIEDLEEYIAAVRLGEDALDVSREQFILLAKGRGATIKGLLLNQKIIAGVGNLYADEICYQTRVHPGSRVSSLSTRKLGEIHERMLAILTLAIDRGAYYKEYPEDWFWAWRDTAQKHEGGRVMCEKIAGRTTYYIKGYQKMYR